MGLQRLWTFPVLSTLMERPGLPVDLKVSVKELQAILAPNIEARLKDILQHLNVVNDQLSQAAESLHVLRATRPFVTEESQGAVAYLGSATITGFVCGADKLREIARRRLNMFLD